VLLTPRPPARQQSSPHPGCTCSALRQLTLIYPPATMSLSPSTQSQATTDWILAAATPSDLWKSVQVTPGDFYGRGMVQTRRCRLNNDDRNKWHRQCHPSGSTWAW